MIATLLLLACAGLTPEEEVEAWEPKYVTRDIDEDAVREGNLRVASVAVPLVAIIGGAMSGAVTAYALYPLTNDGRAMLIGGVGIGLAAYIAYISGGLALFLPHDVPTWTIPVAVVAGTGGLVAGAAFGAAVAYVYVDNRYLQPGTDCFCGPDLLIVPLAPLVFGGLGAVTATSVSVGLADSAVE